MKKILPPILKQKLVEVLSMSPLFSCDESIMPFLANLGSVRYYLYVKNISSAYFPNSPDITRVQLPNRDAFSFIAESDISFILLGYDQDNDVIVCWNPQGLKERLNSSKNVSLYSRQTFQDEVKNNEYKYVYLTNGDKVIMFKRQNLSEFLLNIEKLFQIDEETVVVGQFEESNNDFIEDFVINGKLTKIIDEQLIDQIKPLLLGYSMFEAVTIVMKHYEARFPTMTMKDWSPIVRNLKTKFSEQL